MSGPPTSYVTTPLEPDDTASGFSSGNHPLDDSFARHALANDRLGVGRAYVLRRGELHAPDLPRVLGFSTLSMASVASSQVASVLEKRLPKYPMPVALIGRLAVDARAQGKRLGEALVMDAPHRVVDAAAIVGCLGILVDAKNEGAERFYGKYDFVTVTAHAWPHRLFLPIGVARALFEVDG